MRLRRYLAVAMMALGARAASGQAPPPAAAPQDAERAALIQMKSDLRNLVVAQEAYFADHSAYATDLVGLKFRNNEHVSLRLTATQNNGWAAEARSTQLPTVACVIWVNVAEKYRPRVGGVNLGNAEGEPACGKIDAKNGQP